MPAVSRKCAPKRTPAPPAETGTHPPTATASCNIKRVRIVSQTFGKVFAWQLPRHSSQGAAASGQAGSSINPVAIARASSSSVVDPRRLARDMSYLASSNAIHAAAALVAQSQAIRVGEPDRNDAERCSQAYRRLKLDSVSSPFNSILSNSADRPFTSLSASLAGERLATLKTEAAYRALIKLSFAPILLRTFTTVESRPAVSICPSRQPFGQELSLAPPTNRGAFL